MICFQISIFEPLETTARTIYYQVYGVVICFQISIFEPLETTTILFQCGQTELWFAFKLVSLNHWKQLKLKRELYMCVVICFQISIFEPLETTLTRLDAFTLMLWFAFKLVSLNHWKQHLGFTMTSYTVVICFQISIFEPLETTTTRKKRIRYPLWFAFKLVSLNHWKQLFSTIGLASMCCDLLSN